SCRVRTRYQSARSLRARWIPASAGMTDGKCLHMTRHASRARLDLLPEAGDLLLGFSHQRIELRDLDGVVALFVLAEAEQVGEVLRPPAVEVELVLLLNRLAEPDDGRRLEIESDDRFKMIDIAGGLQPAGE